MFRWLRSHKQYNTLSRETEKVCLFNSLILGEVNCPDLYCFITSAWLVLPGRTRSNGAWISIYSVLDIPVYTHIPYSIPYSMTKHSTKLIKFRENRRQPRMDSITPWWSRCLLCRRQFAETWISWKRMNHFIFGTFFNFGTYEAIFICTKIALCFRRNFGHHTVLLLETQF